MQTPGVLCSDLGYNLDCKSIKYLCVLCVGNGTFLEMGFGAGCLSPLTS